MPNKNLMLSRKQQILNTAARLFRKRGYSATSMRDIAREMQMEAASLYNHINSKQAILSELLLHIAQAFTDGMFEIKNSSVSNIEKLEQLVALHVQMTVDYTDAISLIPNEWVHLEGDAIKHFLNLRDQYEKDFNTLLEAAVKDKKLGDIDIDLASFSILSSLRWLYSWYSKNRHTDVEKLKKEMIRNLIYGLK
ncbi:MAG: TetR/AcrR family transcriptional regulator [Saprospiraceae bacterium]|nr:TetR/AcrR family transcriptional regulator [Saprospiraceae bacterium]